METTISVTQHGLVLCGYINGVPVYGPPGARFLMLVRSDETPIPRQESAEPRRR